MEDLQKIIVIYAILGLGKPRGLSVRIAGVRPHPMQIRRFYAVCLYLSRIVEFRCTRTFKASRQARLVGSNLANVKGLKSSEESEGVQ